MGEMSEKTPISKKKVEDNAGAKDIQNLVKPTTASAIAAATAIKKITKPKPGQAAKGAASVDKPIIKKRVIKNSIDAAEFFGRQYTSTKDLPNPEPSLMSLATGVIEVISGTRQIDQLARILSDGVYQAISNKAIEARANRERRGEKARYQNIRVHAMRNQSPRDGVIESVVLVDIHERTKAVAIRLEGINSRWRATSVSVL